MSDINPYASPEGEPRAPGIRVIVLQFKMSEQQLIDAAAEGKRRFLTSSMLAVVVISIASFFIFHGRRDVDFFALTWIWGIFAVLLAFFGTLDHFCWRSFRATAASEVAELLHAHPSLRHELWEVQIDSRRLILRCEEQLFVWRLDELKRVSINSGRPGLRGACYIKTPLLLMPIPQDAACSLPFADFGRVLKDALARGWARLLL
jgi:hypothetical protein